MPKLLLFTACERIIIDENGNASLIVLLSGVQAAPSEQDIPKNAVTAKEWAVFASWAQEAGDKNKSYTQCLQVLWPDGSEFQKHSLVFVFTKRQQQNRVSIVGFPIGQPGLLTVNMWLETEGTKVTEVYSRRLEITHEAKPEK